MREEVSGNVGRELKRKRLETEGESEERKKEGKERRQERGRA